MSKGYIYKEKALSELCSECKGIAYCRVPCALYNYIDNSTPADVKPVVRGEWVHRKVRHSLPWDCPPYYGEEYDRESHSCLEDEWHCSNCDYETDDIDKEWWNFCPNCGAEMKEEKQDEHDRSNNKN